MAEDATTHYNYPKHINYPKTRKPPKKHRVKAHIRLGKRVESYVRKGIRSGS